VNHLRTAATVLTVLVVAGCSDGDSGNGATVRSGDATACPGAVVDVVVSVGQWGDMVERLGGDCATVTTVVASAAVDPHSFEPSAADVAAFSDAELVVVNGAGYDGWAEAAVANLDTRPAVVSVAELLGPESPEDAHADEHADDVGGDDVGGEHEAGHGGVDPHLWYEPDVLPQMATAVTAELGALSPGAADYFTEQQALWTDEFQPYLDAVAALRAEAAGRTYAATETVFDRMAAHLGLRDATPEGYRRAASNESEPAPGELTAFEAALADGSVDVLVYNAQTRGSIPEQLRAAAEDAGVPVVEVTESPSDAEGSFVAWQLAQFSALSDALSGTP
jgi:zinc/manganese transport system substrate-binding protein